MANFQVSTAVRLTNSIKSVRVKVGYSTSKIKLRTMLTPDPYNFAIEWWASRSSKQAWFSLMYPEPTYSLYQTNASLKSVGSWKGPVLVASSWVAGSISSPFGLGPLVSGDRHPGHKKPLTIPYGLGDQATKRALLKKKRTVDTSQETLQ